MAPHWNPRLLLALAFLAIVTGATLVPVTVDVPSAIAAEVESKNPASGLCPEQQAPPLPEGSKPEFPAGKITQDGVLEGSLIGRPHRVELGTNRPITVNAGAQSTHRVSFNVAEDVGEQGCPDWFAYRGEVEVQLTGRPGTTLISGGTNGLASLQIKVVVSSSGAARWEMRTGLGPGAVGVFRDARARVPVTNYLRFGGLKQGDNWLNVNLDNFDGAAVRSATVEGLDIFRTAGPPGLGVEIREQRGRLTPGNDTRVVARVRNIGGGVQQNVVVRAMEVSGGAVKLTAPKSTTVEELDEGEEAEVDFIIQGLQEGRANLEIHADGRDVEATQLVRVTVAPPIDENRFLAWLPAAVLVLCGSLVLLFGFQSWRRPRPSEVEKDR